MNVWDIINCDISLKDNDGTDLRLFFPLMIDIRKRCHTYKHGQGLMKDFFPIILVLLCVLYAISPARSQSNSYPSDVIILIVPNQPHAIISVTFSKRIPKQVVKQRLNYLISFTGWRVISVVIHDDQLKGMTPGSTTIQTSATLLLDNPLLKEKGAFILQPFLNTFSDFDTFEVIYMEQMDPNFDGLFDFSAPGMTVKLIQYGSPYRYLFRITNHSDPLPTLPLIQHLITNTQQTHRDFGSLAPFALWMIVGGFVGLVMLAIYILRYYRKGMRKE